MIKLLAFFLVLLAIAGFGVMVLWMNLTPGHYQQVVDPNVSCSQCEPKKVMYISDEEDGLQKPQDQFMVGCPTYIQDCSKTQWLYLHITVLNSAKLMLSNLDFNK